MSKHSKGSAYVMVVFVSIPLLLVLLTAFLVSINSRNSAARHEISFTLYELASSKNALSILAFEDAYRFTRLEAHEKAVMRHVNFAQVPIDGSFTLPSVYPTTFRNYATPLIQTRLLDNFTWHGGALRHQFHIRVGETEFTGTSIIAFSGNRVTFVTDIERALPVSRRVSIQARVEWPEDAEKKVYFLENFQIKNLDYFTPRVVELFRR